MSNGLPKFVIVGGGFGGIETAKELRRAPVEVTLVDRQNHHCFSRCYIRSRLRRSLRPMLAWPIRHILRKQKNATVLMAEVHAIGTTKRQAETHSVGIPYDYLVVAAGAAHSYFGHNEWAEVAPEWQLQHRYMQVEAMAELFSPANEQRQLPSAA